MFQVVQRFFSQIEAAPNFIIKKICRSELISEMGASGVDFSTERKCVKISCVRNFTSAMIFKRASEHHYGRRHSYVLFSLCLILKKTGLRVLPKATKKSVKSPLSFKV